MESLTSSCSSSKQFFVKKKKSSHRNSGGGGGGGFSPPHSKTLFTTTTRTELGFFRFQKSKNVDFSHSISLQLIRAIEPVSCSTSQVAEGDMMLMTTEVPTQETYTGKSTVHVKFLLQKECTFGEQFLLVGDDPIFGMWNPSDAIPLDWSEGHIWSVELDIPIEKLIRFKFILKGTTEELVWQPDPDRILQTWETKNTIVVSENWEIAEAQTITEEEPGDNLKQELTADKSSELNLSEDMSNSKEDLAVVDKLSNPNEVLLIEDNTSNPKEEQTAENQDVDGSNSIAVTVDKSTSVDDEDDLVDYEGEPVLVPGLDPFPTKVPKGSLPAVVDTIPTKDASAEDDLVDHEGEPILVPGLAPFSTTIPKGSHPAVVDTISTKDASVELNGNAVDVEDKDRNIPEKYKKKVLDEYTDRENTTVRKISDNGPEKENNFPEELQLEQASFLELLRSDFYCAARGVRQLLKDLSLFRF